jgi:aminoglycoside phosphotransferase (APT) family kinase protein
VLFRSLLTSETVSNLADAQRVVRWYKRRWTIEDFHKAWKTGCGAEERRFQSAENLRRAVTILAFVAVPVFAGRPGSGYPWQWSVVPHLAGRNAAESAVAERGPAASQLAAFLVALHSTADPDAPTNPFRGVPLGRRAEQLADRVRAVAGASACWRWQHQAASPEWPQPPVWIHGDPHPLNLLLGADHDLAAVVDFGDLGCGDPASDLAVAWLMFDADARAVFRAHCDEHGSYDRAIWSRAWAWALGLSAVFCQTSDDMPALAEIAAHGLAQTLGDAEFGAPA